MELNNRISELNDIGQSIWYDNISRQMIESGKLKDLIYLGVTGITSNPSIFENAISKSNHYDSSIIKYSNSDSNAELIFEKLAITDITHACDFLMSAYSKNNSTDGFASIEVSPNLAYDTDATIEAGVRIFKQINRPNVMIKVPATSQGIPAIRELTARGINVNVTLIFSLHAYKQVREAYISGLEERQSSGKSISSVMSVASFFLSRVDTLVDSELTNLDGVNQFNHLLGTAALANAKQAYSDFKKTFTDFRFQDLLTDGANIQRPLWASTSTKNPAYKALLYVEELIGNHVINTMPDNTLNIFLSEGHVQETISKDFQSSQSNLEEIRSVIDLDSITSKLLIDGVKQFADSYNTLLQVIETKSKELSEQKVSM